MRRILVCVLCTIVLTSCGIGNNSASSYNKRGMNYYNEGMYDEAVDNFAKAVEANKNKAEYYINYAMALIEIEEYEEALIQFDNGIVSKDTKITRENNKKVYRGKGIVYLARKEYLLAIEQFDMSMKIDEIRAIDEDILFYKAEAETKAKEYDAAIETYSRIIENNKTNARAYNYRANIYATQGKAELAEFDYDKAISNNKNDYASYIGKYFLLVDMGQDDKARDILNTALGINSKSMEDTLYMARIHFYLGDYEEAFIKLSVVKESGYPEALFYLGSYYEIQGNNEKAIEMYEEYIGNDKMPEASIAHNQLGLILLKNGKYKEALNVIQKGIKLSDETALQALRFNEIAAYEKLASYNKALKRAKEYVKDYPDDEVALKEYEFLLTRKATIK